MAFSQCGRKSQQLFRSYWNLLADFSRRSMQSRSSGYEGAGKTTAQILNIDYEPGILIDGYSQVGFRLNNDVTVLGSIIMFPRTILSWNVRECKEINEDSLSLFKVIEPKLDLLLIGYGFQNDNNRQFLDNLLFLLRQKLKINCEIMPTDKAVHTFNFLVSDGRFVAGALIPPEKIAKITDDDLYQHKRIYHNLYDEAT